MARKLCELCGENYEIDTRYGVKLCEDCLAGISKALRADEKAMIYYSDESNFPNATDLAKIKIIQYIREKRIEEEQKRIEEEQKRQEELELLMKQREIQFLEDQKKQEYSNSFGEFYEYDVEVVHNMDNGGINQMKMKQVLNQRARQGWELHTVYSNELGKNSSSTYGIGTNATICEDVLVFKRRIKNFE